MHRPYQEQLVLGSRVVGSSATGSSSTSSPSLPMFALSTAATVAAATAASATAVTSSPAVSSFHHGVGGGATGTGGGAGHHHHLQVVPPHIPPPPNHFSLSHHLNQPPSATHDSSPGFSNPSKVVVQSSPSAILIQQHQHQHQQQQQQIQNKHHQLMQQLGLGRSSEDSDPAGSDQTYGPSKSSQPIQQQQQPQQPAPGGGGTTGGGTGNSSVVSREISSAGGEDDPGMDDGERGGVGGGPRWLKEETSALIKIRIDMDRNFRDSPLKGPLWEEVSRKLGELGYQRSSKKCKEKFENVYKYYKKSKDGRAGRQDGKSYRFFADMEALFSTAGVGGGGGGGGGSNAGTPVSTAPLATNILHGGLNSNAPGANTSNNNRMLAFQHELNHPGNSSTPSSMQLTALAETTTNTGEDDTTETSDEVDEDDEYEDVVHTSTNDHMLSRKRKRGGTARWGVIEAMMRQLLERQESMQKRFLEAMDKRDAERTARDDAWRRQETARVRREQELRAQEQTRVATRDAALMAFLHKACSGGVPPAQSQQLLATLASLLSNTGTASVADRTADISPQQVVEDHHHHHQPLMTHGSTMDVQHDIVTVRGDSGGFDPASKRWPKPEVLALIKLRSNMENKFQETGPKGPLWEEISAGMSCLGYSRSSKRCKEKWENINKYFRKTKDSSKKRPENSKTCPYFHQLDALYRKGILGGTRLLTAGSSLGSKRDDDKNSGGAAGQLQGGGQTLGQPNQSADMLAIVPTSATNGGGEHNNSGAPATGSVGSPRNNGGFSGPDEEDEDDEDNMSTEDKELSNNNENGNGNHGTNASLSTATTTNNGHQSHQSQQQPQSQQQQQQQQQQPGKGGHGMIGLLDTSNGHHPHQHHHHHYPTPLAMSCEASELFSGSSNMLGEFERREQQQQQQQQAQQNGRR